MSNLNSIYTCIIGAMIAILGFSLSGIAIIAGLFPSSIVIEIDKGNGAGTLKYLLSSYVFSQKCCRTMHFSYSYIFYYFF